MRVRELLDVPDLRLRLLTDVTGMDRAIRHVYTRRWETRSSCWPD